MSRVYGQWTSLSVGRPITSFTQISNENSKKMHNELNANCIAAINTASIKIYVNWCPPNNKCMYRMCTVSLHAEHK